MYILFELPRNKPAFSINNFVLVPAKVVIFFPTVFRGFVLFRITVFGRPFVSI